ncbi:MAG: hypothetical protein NXI26_27735 [bacterium]|nr:hypothetical protein [bacterium]
MRIGFANYRAKYTLRLQPLNTVLGVMELNLVIPIAYGIGGALTGLLISRVIEKTDRPRRARIIVTLLFVLVFTGIAAYIGFSLIQYSHFLGVAIIVGLSLGLPIISLVFFSKLRNRKSEH